MRRIRVRPLSVCIGLSFILVLLSPVVAIYLHFTPRESRVYLSGIVVEKDTDAPVADARIVVSLRVKGYPYEGYVAKYGLRSDRNGKFFIDRLAPKRFHDVWIEVSTPSDEFGSMQVTSPQKDLVVTTAPLPDVLQKFSYMHYAHFTGGTPSAGIDHLDFINEPW
jgi:hypothetical protein